MSRLQVGAGQRYRSAAALAVAEAGIHALLGALERAPAGASVAERFQHLPGAMEVDVGHLRGRYSLLIEHETRGTMSIISAGEVAGLTRRVRARVHIAPAALLSALHAEGIVRVDGAPSSVVIGPAGADLQPWSHVSARRGFWVVNPGAVRAGPGNSRASIAPRVDEADGPPDGAPTQRAPLRIMLAADARLFFGHGQEPVALHQLRAIGVLDGVVIRPPTFPKSPAIDHAFYEGLAAGNYENAPVNRAAGRYARDSDLARKRDSLYAPRELEQVQAFLQTLPDPPALRGVVYVRGRVVIPPQRQLRIADGALIAEGTVQVGPAATLRIGHSPARRRLPGLIVLDRGALVVAPGASLEVHGLLYAGRIIDVGEGARVAAVGAIVAADPDVSIRSMAAALVIRRDAAVLGTPGLIVEGSPVVGWSSAFEELP